MSITVCLLPAGTLDYPNGGGHRWVYLNWALGFRALGCRVIWLEGVSPRKPEKTIQANIESLKRHLEPYGLAECVALYSLPGAPLPRPVTTQCLDLDAATEADILLNQRYGAPAELVARFRRTALLDIDPGLLQTWMSKRWVQVAPHDAYFTIGEFPGHAEPCVPDVGLTWHHVPPCVALDWWPLHPAADGAPFTTLAHWYAGGGAVDSPDAYADDKRSGFLPFLDLPRRTTQQLELALDIAGRDLDEQQRLERAGWLVRDAYAVSSTPGEYQRYVQGSRGEFSCAKPSYVRMRTAWLSDRTVCYLASGKPAVVQHTGPSRFLPDAGGLFRFCEFDDAVRSLELIAADYEHQSRLARTLAEEHFDAKKITHGMLERALS